MSARGRVVFWVVVTEAEAPTSERSTAALPLIKTDSIGASPWLHYDQVFLEGGAATKTLLNGTAAPSHVEF
jgi:hypothetical protein